MGIVGLLLWLDAFLVGTPFAHAADGEKYLSWHVDYAVQADGSVDVTETLEYQFAGSDSHGLKRWIITSQGYDPDSGKYRVYESGTASRTFGDVALDMDRFAADMHRKLRSLSRKEPKQR